MAPDLGQLLRLQGMIESAATSVEPEGSSAPALTQAYARLRVQVRNLIGESDPSLAEFDGAFPEIEVVELQILRDPADTMLHTMQHKPHATRAQVLLAQLAGWVSGLINDLTFEQRLRIDAEARAKQSGA